MSVQSARSQPCLLGGAAPAVVRRTSAFCQPEMTRSSAILDSISSHLPVDRFPCFTNSSPTAGNPEVTFGFKWSFA